MTSSFSLSRSERLHHLSEAYFLSETTSEEELPSQDDDDDEEEEDVNLKMDATERAVLEDTTTVSLPSLASIEPSYGGTEETHCAIVFSIHGIGREFPSLLQEGLILPECSTVIEFSYDTEDIVGETSTSHGINDAAKKLLERATEHFTDTRDAAQASIVFLACDIGGSIVKQALVLASESSKYSEVLARSTVLVFFGTPHRAPLTASRDYCLLNLVHSQFRGLYGPWLPHVINCLADFHDELAQKFDTINGRFTIVNYFQEEDESASYDVAKLVDSHSATLDIDGETKIGLRRTHCGLADIYQPVHQKILMHKIGDAQAGIQKDHGLWLRLLSTYGSDIPLRRPSKPLLKNLCRWILSGNVLGDWISNTAGSLDPREASPRSVASTISKRSRASVVGSILALAVGEVHSHVGTVISSLIGVIKDKRETTDTFVTLAHLGPQKRPLTKGQLTASLCRQLLIAQPQLVGQVATLFKEAKEALRGQNDLWANGLLWRCLKALLRCQGLGQVFLIIHQPEDSTLARPFLDLIASLQGLLWTTELHYKILIIRKSKQALGLGFDPSRAQTSVAESGELGRQPLHPQDLELDSLVEEHINLQCSEAVVAIRKDYEAELDEVVQMIHHAVSRKQRGVRITLPQDPSDDLMARPPFALLEQYALQKLHLAFNFFGYDPTGSCKDIITTALDRMSDSFRPQAKVGLLWVTNAIRPLTCAELDEILRLFRETSADSKSTLEVTAREFLQLLPGIIEMCDNLVFLNNYASPGLFGATSDGDHTTGTSNQNHRWNDFASDPNLVISQTCIDYLMKNIGDTLVALPGAEAPLLRYAVEYWFTHIQESNSPAALEAQPMASFLDDLNHIKLWLQLRASYRATTPDACPLISCPSYIQVKQGLGVTTLKALDLMVQASTIESFPKQTDWSSLALAVSQRGDKEVLFKLSETGRIADEPTLQRIFESGCDEALCQLSRSNSDHVRSNVNKILRDAVRRGNLRLAEFLAAEYRDQIRYENYQTPLLQTAAYVEVPLPNGVVNEQRKFWNYTDQRRYNRSPLHLAAISGNVPLMSWLVDSRPNKADTVDLRDSSKATPLHLAVKNGQFSVASQLIEAGADSSARDENDQTPLHEAAANGYCDTVDCLLRSKSSMRVKNNQGKTPLHVALDNGYPNVALTLLTESMHLRESDAHTQSSVPEEPYTPIREVLDVNSLDLDGLSPLILAVRLDNPEVVKSLLAHGARVDLPGQSGRTPLHAAAEFGLGDSLDLLLDKMATMDLVDEQGHTPLHLAARRGHVAVVKKLLDRRAKSDIKDAAGLMPFDVACSNGQVATAQVLLGAKDSYSTDQLNNNLLNAAVMGSFEIAQLLLDSGANKDAQYPDGDTVLHQTANKSDTRMLQLLLGRRADLDRRGATQQTPLFHSILRNSVVCVRMFLNAGANVNAEDKHGITPIIAASVAGYHEIVDMLLKAGASLNDLGVDDDLLDTVFSNFSLKVFAVIARHVAGEERGRNLVSPKAFKAMLDQEPENRVDIVKTLLDCGTDPNWKIDGHGTLLHMAAREDMLDLVDLLTKDGPYRAELDIPNEIDGTPMQIAALNGNRNVVDLLLSRGADPTRGSGRYGSPLHAAVAGNDRKTIELLLNSPKGRQLLDLEAGYYGSVLQAAATLANSRTVSLLLNYEPKLDVITGVHGTPLHAAVSSHKYSVVELLLRRVGRAILCETPDNGGRLALHLAAAADDVHLMEQVTTERETVLTPDKQRRHALHFAAGSGATMVAEKILHLYRNAVHDADCDGWTPLHWACRQDDDEMIELLIQQGAQRNKTTLRGWKPIDVAIYHRKVFDAFDRVQKLLQTGEDAAPQDQFLNRVQQNQNAVMQDPESSRWTFLAEQDDDEEERLPAMSADRALGVICHSCECKIYGPRYKCMKCEDWDACFKCFRHIKEVHYKGHGFNKYTSSEEWIKSLDPWDCGPKATSISLSRAGSTLYSVS